MGSQLDLQIKLFKLEHKLGLTETKLELLCRWISTKFAGDTTLPLEVYPRQSAENEGEVVGHANVKEKPPNRTCGSSSSVKQATNKSSTQKNDKKNHGSSLARGSLPVPLDYIKHDILDGDVVRIVDIRSIMDPTEPDQSSLDSIPRTRQPYFCRICNMKFRTVESLRNHKMTHCFVQVTSLDSGKASRVEVAEDGESSNSYDNDDDGEDFEFQPTAEENEMSDAESMESILEDSDYIIENTGITKRRKPLMSDRKGSNTDPDFQSMETEGQEMTDGLTGEDALTFPYRSKSGEMKRRRRRNFGDFMCAVCGIRFAKPRYVREHKSRNHPEVYKQELEDRQRLIKDKADKKKKRGENPVESASTSTQKDAGKQANRLPRRQRNIGNYQCNVCQKRFPVERYLKQHRRLYHPEEYKLDLERAKNAPKIRVPNCRTCGEQFATFTLLKQHRQNDSRCRRHKKDPNEIIRCEECNIIYTVRGGLNQHNRTVHLKERPFLCTECGATFARNYYLKRHLELHSEERKYNCRYCPKSFRQKPGLDIHMKRHFKSTSQLQCFRCGQFFLGVQNLQTHINEVHEGLRPHSCPTCPKSFKKKAHLKYHLKTHEKPGGRQRGLNKEREPGRRREPNKLAIEPVIEANPDGPNAYQNPGPVPNTVEIRTPAEDGSETETTVVVRTETQLVYEDVVEVETHSWGFF